MSLEPPSHPSAFSRALRKAVASGRFTLSELAEEADVSTRHLNKVKNQKAHLNHEAADRVRRYCCRNAYPSLSETACCASYRPVKKATGEADGSFADDVAEVTRQLGRIMDGGEDRSKQKVLAAIDKVKAELEDLRAEANQLE